MNYENDDSHDLCQQKNGRPYFKSQYHIFEENFWFNKLLFESVEQYVKYIYLSFEN